jgi:hypothetical protein
MLRDRIARALPDWSDGMPGHHALLGMHAFGLEETGHYARAEAAGRRAIELEPRNGWAQHAVAHVCEMQDRRADGIAWIARRPDAWSPRASSPSTTGGTPRSSTWAWTRRRGAGALRRPDLRRALDLAFDWSTPRPCSGGCICAASTSATAGRAGRRLRRRSRAAVGLRRRPRDAGLRRDGRDGEAAATLAAMRAACDAPGDNAALTRDVGLPVAEAIVAFGRGDYADASTLLRDVRNGAARFGGSHAQRDLLDLTLIAAARRAGHAALERALLAERAAAQTAAPTRRAGYRCDCRTGVGISGRIGLAAALALAGPPVGRAGAPLQTDDAVHPGWTPQQQSDWYRAIETVFKVNTIKRGPTVHPLPKAAKTIDPTFSYGGKDLHVDSYMAAYNVSGLLVLKDGKILLERYAMGRKPDRALDHLLGRQVGHLHPGRRRDPGRLHQVDRRPVTRYVPDLKGSAYEGVSVRQMLMMSSGVKWNEDYVDPSPTWPVAGTQAAEPGVNPMVSYLRKLPAGPRPGSTFNYNTGETDLVGVLVSKATGKSLAQYASEKLWKPYGMEADGIWMTDRAARSAAAAASP